MIKKLRSSIFDFNTAFLNLSDNDIAEKTGIDIKRVKLLAAGEEPLLSDIIAMSAAFDRSILSLLAGEYFMYKFGEYYTPENEFLEKIIKEGNIKALVFIFSSGLIVKEADDLKFVRYGRITEGRKVDKGITKKAIAVLLGHGLPGIASEISSTDRFYQVSELKEITFSKEVLRKYLFIEGKGSFYPYFVPFFNALADEADKLALLDMTEDNLKAYMKKKLVFADGGGKPYVYYVNEKNGLKEMSAPWRYCDFSGLQIQKDRVRGLEGMQREVFKK